MNFEGSLAAALHRLGPELNRTGNERIDHFLDGVQVRPRIHERGEEHVSGDSCGGIDPGKAVPVACYLLGRMLCEFTHGNRL